MLTRFLKFQLSFFAMPEMIRIPYSELEELFCSILLHRGFAPARAAACAEIFATNSLEGVYTHGVNRFAFFVRMVDEGHVVPNAESFLVHATPALEQWDGALGPGVLQAVQATDRAVALAKAGGLGCVALANTNHWMRGGYYGWRAAKAGCVFIGWSNTIANMPAHGATDARLGNNPLVLAVPFQGQAIVLDMAMSQFSYGAMQLAQQKGEELPVYGGYDQQGRLTKDPAAILETSRTVPIGYWKGAGLSLLLDIVGAVLSGGLATHEISRQKSEKGLSQVFLAIDLSQLKNYPGIEHTIQGIVSDYKASTSAGDVLFPGERVMKTRAQNLQEGIPVLKPVLNEILALRAPSKSK